MYNARYKGYISPGSTFDFFIDSRPVPYLKPRACRPDSKPFEGSGAFWPGVDAYHQMIKLGVPVIY
jgi:hypothetical protein